MHQHDFKALLIQLLLQSQRDQNAFFQQLPPAELAVIGEPDYWSAKDHVSHLTYWRQRLVLRLQAYLRHEAQTPSGDFEQINPIVFEQNRHRLWPDILAESDQAYDDLIALTQQLSDEELLAFDRFDWLPKGIPLYLSFMGNCYEHTQIHLSYYLIDRHQPERALEVYENWSNRVIEAEVPDELKGNILYNLACFYATHDLLAKAGPTLQKAIALYPPGAEFAQTDPDLALLRETLN
ncbi:hypothetical protein KDA_27930 [Dictyobacter alpinus]|uniref:DinB-like domain-containing protein n=1 Tax=Dictyobacter alpinus TaxID=2014873 RepID=A0A402B7L0_9CHLR|nr:DinB family protein [Dictyobacter alpinus]GCE27309.1 hypothetical protein KDA_27930 [Dictyobacter alpinus]